MSHLIEGHNPFTITDITWHRAHRWAVHPYEITLYKRRHPVWSFFGSGPIRWTKGVERILPEHAQYSKGTEWFPAHVSIALASGKCHTINCNSNDSAIAFHAELNSQLEEFLASATIKKDDNAAIQPST